MQTSGATETGTGTRTSAPGRPYTITGFVLAAVGLILVPILFGPAGAIFGGIGYSKGDKPLGMWAVAAGVAATIGGMVLAAIVLSNN